MNKTTVVVVDDSALIRKLLTEIINSQSDMQVIGTAADPLAAREMIREMNPDVLTLDIEMPKMDGIDFLEKLMRLRPMPVIMVSTLTDKGSEVTLKALELGAVDFVSKPKIDIAAGLKEYSQEITNKIRIAKSARIKRLTPSLQITKSASADAILPAVSNRIASTEKLIIVGASTGGTEAIKEFLIHMPPDSPGILITQHMPEGFTKSFANRLNSLCRISVMEAQGGERVLPGHAFIAPGHSHLLLKRSGANYMTELNQGELVSRHRPSVDVLFRSAANCAGKNAIGVILTGMGKDGAAGMLEMHKAGAYNFAQDELSCVVFGMPKEAIAAGGVDEVVPLKDIARSVLTKLSSMGMRSNRV
ncbi:chemotaxis response regulator protein-glutamate methylesterase [Nitrosomonas sp. JL21]|uniref:protein-glutamate methylesterase/protein-glutamine glutaminase n=1 Tax=Nitrosomonas sp. JL21 TaxID=153949 RepID=UPI00136DD960|nr:chemotaxis response regulator protein-glutamate methylesterase [Nitrosomonas sp. JL21]MBL8497599.1 chemotaxis response regulator protein-glutamate methylesterase [Nitrosomonas sp.]MXS77803.1 chemotaxis response regulator protein-glutamate methylesterase [Nitrosomonas sp. JL21]